MKEKKNCVVEGKFLEEKKIFPLRRKNLNPTEEYIDKQIIELANSTSEYGKVAALKRILEAIQYCNEYKMYYVRELAIARAIRRCNFEIELMTTPCEHGEEEELIENLAKKYDLT